jgi:RNA polymerase sigma-70 factor (ECF subfamily)
MNTEGADVLMCRIVRSYADMLLHLAYSRLQSEADAEDCVQEVYCKLLRYQPEFRDAEHEKAWLIRATMNQAADMRRARSRQNLPLDEATTVCAAEASDLLSCVRALPDRYALVIHLHYYEGYKLSEIAKLLSLPTATVGTRLARGRARLKQMLEE